MLGDFVKGPVLSDWPTDVAFGIRLHRRVDVLTDSDSAWKASRDRFPKALRRFAGIAVDLFYDHILARDWSRHHAEELAVFTARAYRDIAGFASLFPPRLERIFPMMKEQDWLTSYVDVDNTVFALTRMSHRSPRLAPLAQTATVGRDLVEDMAADFEEFFPRLVAQVEVERRGAING